MTTQIVMKNFITITTAPKNFKWYLIRKVNPQNEPMYDFYRGKMFKETTMSVANAKALVGAAYTYRWHVKMRDTFN